MYGMMRVHHGLIKIKNYGKGISYRMRGDVWYDEGASWANQDQKLWQRNIKQDERGCMV